MTTRDTAPDFVPALRAALTAADYHYDAVVELLGERAHDALQRNETAPGLASTRQPAGRETPLATLVRLFLLQTPVPTAAAERALPGLLDRLSAEGLVEQSIGEVAARIDIRPYGASDARGEHRLWVLSDLTPGLDGGSAKVGGDHVLGISAASSSLAQLTLRRPVGRALDLGTGCGVQALHLAGHAETVVATDVNERALWLTRLNAALNEADGVDVRAGSFFEPVADETFDLIATNPPFVISPATGERLVYRDSGLPGDQVVSDIVRAAPAHLNDGGWCQVLANWVIRSGTPWDDRLAEWLGDDVDALVVQREVVDPAAYVELWLKDSGDRGGPAGVEEYLRRYETWLSWFEAEGIEAVGFGWITLRKRPVDAPGEPIHTLVEWPYEVEQPIAPAIAEFVEASRAVAELGTEALLAAHPVRRPDVRQETVGEPGAEDPEVVVLRQQTGFRRARQTDTVEAGLVGACDGELSIGQILAALAQLLEREPASVVADYLPKVRELLVEGFLELD